MIRHISVFVLVSWAFLSPAAAEGLKPAFTGDDIDVAHCRAVVDGEVQSRPTLEALTDAFLLTPGTAVWSTEKSSARARHLIVTFNKPVTIGTVCAPDYPGTVKIPLREPKGRFVSMLKADAPYPGDPNDESQWKLLRSGAVKYLPVATKTRALRFSEVSNRPRRRRPKKSVLGKTLCLRDRYYNATDLGSTSRRQLEGDEQIFASWLDPVPLAGVFLDGPAAGESRISILDDECKQPAERAEEKAWKPIDERRSGPMLTLDPVVKTRAVRVRAPLNRRRRSALPNVLPLVDLGDRRHSPGVHRPAPYKVPFTMPLSGFAAIDIHDKESGRLVRRLIGETAREKGSIKEPWDLRGEKGQIVPPGEYSWRGLAVPPFKRTYELTLYNAGQPAWRAPPPQGKGGGMWLADHVPPQCAAAQGDIMWLGTGCTENGHCFIATDLEGNKLWGTGHISEGFRGPSRIAVDDRCAYGITNTIIYRVDPEREFKGRNIFKINPTAKRPWPEGHGQPAPDKGGLAARDGKLYVAINMPDRWLKSSFIADTMDPTRSEPSVRLYKNNGKRRANEKVDKVYGVGRYDELQSFYATFLTERMPKETLSYANVPIPCNGEAYFGDAPTEGKNRGRLVAVLRKPVTVGSILIPDGAIKVQVLRRGVPLSKAVISAKKAMADDKEMGGESGVDDAQLGDLMDDLKDDLPDDGIWITLKNQGEAGKPTVALAPEGGLKTRAIRYEVKRLHFTQVMAHRLGDITRQAERVFSEGFLTPQGGVRVRRRECAVTDFNPAVMALRWVKEHKTRGLSFMRAGSGRVRPQLPTRIAVDSWRGERPMTEADLEKDRNWKKISTFSLPDDVTLFQADFGRTIRTSALRVRCLNGYADRETGDYVSGFHGVVAYEPVGGDPEDIPENMSQRIAVLDLPGPEDDKSEAKVIEDIPLSRPNALAFDADGVLHCMSAGQIITVPLEEGQTRKVVVTRDKFEKPVQFTFGPEGLIYVTDNGPKVVKVFDPETGEQVRTIGTPGGRKAGKWDPMRLIEPTQVAVDKNGRIWVADKTYTPKRIMVFNEDGSAWKWFLGPTQYGGGGSMDPRDRSIVMYNGMKFRINWEDRTWKLESLLGHNVERCIYYDGRRYVVGPFPGGGRLVKICYEKDGIAIPVVVAGRLGEWKALRKHPDLAAKLSGYNPSRTHVIWSDANGDRVPQPEEAQVLTGRHRKDGWNIGEDLALFSIPTYHGNGIRLQPAKFTSDGVPLYDAEETETIVRPEFPGNRQRAWGDEKGRIFLTGTGLLDADGKTLLWKYPNPYSKHDGFYAAPFRYDRPPGVLGEEHVPIAHFKVGGEEFYVNNGVSGDWYCYTADGMLVGCLFGGPRGYGKRYWPAKWEKGRTELFDLRLRQEHYQGCVVKANDGNVYAIAGHNHMSVVRIEGLEKLQRMSGEITVTANDIKEMQKWQAREDLLRRAKSEPKIATMLRAGHPPAVSGTLEEWPNEIFTTVAQTVQPRLSETLTILESKAAIGYDAKNLYLAMKVRDESPMRNSAQDYKTLFKGGDAVDLTLGLDPDADPKRHGPVAGDLRLLLSMIKEEPVVVVYKPIDPGAPADAEASFVSPIGKIRMDCVERIDGAELAIKTDRYDQLRDGITIEGTYWTLEAAIPWAEIGADPPEPGSTIRGDFGYLQSDEHGTHTTGRVYWSGKTQKVVSDTPSEARLRPALWGQFVVTKSDARLHFIEPVGTTPPSVLEEEDDGGFGDDILQELGE